MIGSRLYCTCSLDYCTVLGDTEHYTCGFLSNRNSGFDRDLRPVLFNLSETGVYDSIRDDKKVEALHILVD